MLSMKPALAAEEPAERTAEAAPKTRERACLGSDFKVQAFITF